VVLIKAAPVPRVERSDGGIWLASLGVGGDEPEKELNEISGKLATGVKQPAKIRVATEANQLSDLFAPLEPRVTPMTQLVLWSAPEGSLAWWVATPDRLQAFLHHFSGLPMPQVLFLADDGSPDARLVAWLLHGLGIEVRRLENDSRVLAEVQRPDGTILSTLLGAHWPMQDAQVDPYLSAAAKERAEIVALGDSVRCQRLDEQERRYLAEQLARCCGAKPIPPVIRSTALRRLLLPVARKGDAAAWRALFEDLLRREFPFALITEPDGRVGTMSWPGFDKVIPAYPSQISMRQAAKETNRDKRPFVMGAMKPRDLFAWAVKIGTPVALNVYDDAGQPLYVMLSVADMTTLAQGLVPQR
jgi:hypothetical protein